MSTSQLRISIADAVKIQRERQGKKNAELRPDEVFEFCKMDAKADELLKKEAEKNDFSPRAVSSCMKLARTICDMEKIKLIGVKQVKEAVALRKVNGGLAL